MAEYCGCAIGKGAGETHGESLLGGSSTPSKSTDNQLSDEPEEEEPAPEAKGHATGSGSIRDVRGNEAEAIDTAATAILARGTSANPEDLVSAFGPGREPGLVRVGSMC